MLTLPGKTVITKPLMRAFIKWKVPTTYPLILPRSIEYRRYRCHRRTQTPIVRQRPSGLLNHPNSRVDQRTAVKSRSLDHTLSYLQLTYLFNGSVYSKKFPLQTSLSIQHRYALRRKRSRWSGQCWSPTVKYPRQMNRQMLYIHPQTSHSMIFVNTPGFDATYKLDADILSTIAKWLNKM